MTDYAIELIFIRSVMTDYSVELIFISSECDD